MFSASSRQRRLRDDCRTETELLHSSIRRSAGQTRHRHLRHPGSHRGNPGRSAEAVAGQGDSASGTNRPGPRPHRTSCLPSSRQPSSAEPTARRPNPLDRDPPRPRCRRPHRTASTRPRGRRGPARPGCCPKPPARRTRSAHRRPGNPIPHRRSQCPARRRRWPDRHRPRRARPHQHPLRSPRPRCSFQYRADRTRH